MYKIVLKKQTNSYWPVKSITIEGDILTNFLLSDVITRAISWIEWINDPTDQCASANATLILKDPDCPGDILLGDILTDGLFDIGPYFTIKKSNLIDVLNTWNELYNQKVPYIVITIDDQHVHIEGKTSIE